MSTTSAPSVRGALDRGLRHRRRGEPHVSADSDGARLEVLDVCAADAVGAVPLAELDVQAADVVGLEHGGVEHGSMLTAAHCGTFGTPVVVSTLQGWSASSPPCCSSTSSTPRASSRAPTPRSRRRVNEFFETVSSCVAQHGGLVEKFAGDAVLAAFGVPQAHEDDASGRCARRSRCASRSSRSACRRGSASRRASSSSRARSRRSRPARR